MNLAFSILAAVQMFTVQPEPETRAFRNPFIGPRDDIISSRNGFIAPLDTNPYVSVARHYIRWSDIENGEADGVEKIRDFCNVKWQHVAERNVKVIPRVYLDYGRAPGDEYWPADIPTGDYSSDKFKRRLKRLIARLGECWDEDPRVAWVQMGLIGCWGEHHTPTPDLEMQRLLGIAFNEAFKHKKITIRYACIFTEFNFGFYDDSWSVDKLLEHVMVKELDRLVNKEHRYYDQVIEGEFAYGYRRNGWKTVYPGESIEEILMPADHLRWVKNSIRRLHCSALGCMYYYPTNSLITAGAAELQNAFGYHYRLDSVSWTPSIAPNERELTIDARVTNVGSAPMYYRWPVNAALLEPATRKVVWDGDFDADIRLWRPGEEWSEVKQTYLKPPVVNQLRGTFKLPATVANGKYVLALSVLDPAGRRPSLRFSTKNYFKGGRHPIGFVHVGVTPSEPSLTGVKFDDLPSDFSLSYDVQATKLKIQKEKSK